MIEVADDHIRFHFWIGALPMPRRSKANPKAHHRFLYFSMASVTVCCWSFGTNGQQLHFSRVPTGPPQQGKNGFKYPGVLSASWSSIPFFAASFKAPPPRSILLKLRAEGCRGAEKMTTQRSTQMPT